MVVKKINTGVCHVCSHPQRRAIENAILDGKSYKAISRASGVSVGSLSRHKNNHLAKEVAKSLGTLRFDSLPDVENLPVLHASVPPIEDIAAQIKYLYVSAVSFMNACEKKGNYSGAISSNKQALTCLDLFFKASEELVRRQKRDTTVSDVDILRRDVLKALTPYKEAKLEVAKAMLKITQDTEVQ